MDNNNNQPLQNETVNNQPVQPAQPVQPQQPEQPAQPEMSGYAQPMQPGQTGYAQPMQQGQTDYYGQPVQPGQTGYGQPVQPGQTGYGQSMQQGQTGYYGQPMQQGQTGYGQPMQQGQTGYYGQPMQPGQMGYGQPMQPGQMGYGQPNMYNQAPKPPKPPRKPLSKKAKTGIIAGSIGAVVLIVFFAVILPILLKAKLQGEYTYTDSWDDEYRAIFTDGTYVIYDYDDEIYEAGIYTIKDDKVTLLDIEGDDTKATFDAKKNKICISGQDFEINDKKAKVGFKLTETYLDTLEQNVENAVAKLVKDEDLLEIASWSYYYLSDDDLKDPEDDFVEAFANELNYSTDKALSTMVEAGYIAFDIDVYSDGTYEAEVSVY